MECVIVPYANVARESGCSVSSVSKYVQMKDISQRVRVTVNDLMQSLQKRGEGIAYENENLRNTQDGKWQKSCAF